MNTIPLRAVAAIGGAAALLVAGCDGCTSPPDLGPAPAPCDEPTLENLIDAGEGAQAEGIVAYRYTAGLDARALTLELRDEANGAQEMTVEQVQDHERFADGTLLATLGDLELSTRGAVLADGRERVLARLSRGDDVIGIEVDLAQLPCRAPDAGLHCAGALDTAAPHVLLPSCGLPYDATVRAGRAPTVVGLRYLVPAADASGEGTGVARRDGQSWVTVDVMEAGAPRPAADVVAEVEAVGGPLASLLEATDARQLVAAFFDRSWRWTLQLHAATCIAEGAFDITGGPTVASAVTAGSNTNRDSGSWNDGGNSGGGRAWGDPHLVTFDGVAYDFQAAGDYLLAASTDGEVVVHARFEPRDGGPDICREVTWTTGAAFLIEGRVYVWGQGRLLIDGEPAEADDLGDNATLSGGELEVTAADGTRVSAFGGGGTMNITVVPGDGRTFIGLLGDNDGDPENDFRLREDGDLSAPLSRPLAFDTLYGAYRDGWRLTPEASLFTYDDAEGPDTFFDAAFPTVPATLDLVAPALLDPAQVACEADGLTAADALFDCVLDRICQPDDGLAPPQGAGGTDQDTPGVSLEGALVLAPRPEVFDPGASDDVEEGACVFPSAPTIRVFDEGELTLEAPLDVDVFGAARVTSLDEAPAGTLPAGTTLRSWLLHLPPRSAAAAAEGRLRFADRVLGLILRSDGLEDPRFVPASQDVVDAPSPEPRLGDGAFIALDEDEHTVSLAWRTGADAEQVRVVVEVQP